MSLDTYSPTEAVDRTVGSLETADTQMEQTQALVDLQDMMDDMSQEDQETIVAELEEKGVLPELSLIFANENHESIDRDGKGLSHGDLLLAKSSNDDVLESALLDQLREDRPEINNYHNTRWKFDTDITTEDTQAGLANYRNSRMDNMAENYYERFRKGPESADTHTEVNQVGSGSELVEHCQNISRELLKEDGHLFDLLDENDGELDGVINREGLEQYLNVWSQATDGGRAAAKEGPLSMESATLAKNLLGQLNTEVGHILTNGTGEITRESLSRASNIENMEDLKEVPESLVNRSQESETKHRITVAGGGREIESTILLPDNYDPSKEYPVVVGLHSYPGTGDGFGELTRAEEMREAGMIVVLPSSQDGQWKSDREGINIMDFQSSDYDDVEGVQATIQAVNEMYGTDTEDINLLGFSQGGTMAIEVARDMNEYMPANRIFMIAGTMQEVEHLEQSGLSNIDIYRFQGGADGMEFSDSFGTTMWGRVPTVGISNNMVYWHGKTSGTNPDFVDGLASDKGCALTGEESLGDDVRANSFSCNDGSEIVQIIEDDVKHTYPGQPERFDDAKYGEGSKADFDMTDFLKQTITEARS